MLYPLYVLNRSSFNNMLPNLSFTLSYAMNVNDVLYRVITIYTAYHAHSHLRMCVLCVDVQVSCALLLLSFSHDSRNFS